MKLCSKCKDTKCKTLFGKNSSRYDGLQEYCRDCKRAIDRAYYKTNSNRRALIDARSKLTYDYCRKLTTRYKRICGCKLCDEKEPCALDFHHLDPTQKDLEVTRMSNFSIKRLKLEIRKCVVLCSNCHRKVHAGILDV